MPERGKTYTGRLTISRVHSTDRQTFIAIRVEDAASGTQPIEIHLEPVEYADAVTGVVSACTFDVRPDRLGTRHEFKEESMTFPGRPDDAGIAAALWERESLGWKARMDDFSNHHRVHVRPNGAYVYTIGFDRWVPITEEVPT